MTHLRDLVVPLVGLAILLGAAWLAGTPLDGEPLTRGIEP